MLLRRVWKRTLAGFDPKGRLNSAPELVQGKEWAETVSAPEGHQDHFQAPMMPPIRVNMMMW